MADQVNVASQTRQAAGLAPLLGDFPFSVNLGPASGANLKLPAAAEFTEQGFAQRVRELDDEADRNGRDTDRYRSLWESLRRDVQMHAARLDGLLGLFTKDGLDLTSGAEVQAAAKERADHLQAVFDEAMTATLAAQRELEQSVWSLNAFFLEGGCDGEAKSVYVINHNPDTDEAARARGETSIQQMPADPRLGNLHPIWDTAVDVNGKPMPVTFRPIDEKNVIQTMCAALAVGANFRGKRQMGYWARHAANAKAVAFANVDPRDCGPAPWDPAVSPKTLRENYTDESTDYQSIAAVANHPVVREPTRYEKAGVTAFPAFALLGRVYRHGKFDKDASMTVAPVGPTRGALNKEWVKRLSCPWLRDRRGETNQINVVFIDESDNRLGDDVVINYNTASTAFSPRRVPFTLKLGEYWLERVVTHHLLQNVGAPNTTFAAQQIGQTLSVKLSGMSSEVSEDKVFLRAWVDWEKSTCEQEVARDPATGEPMMRDGQPVYTGRWVQKHIIHVQYREGVENFEVVVTR